MSTPKFVLALLLAPLLALGALILRESAGQGRLFPDIGDGADIARIEIAHGVQQVVLQRAADTGAWRILSAADAPGNAPRIEAALRELAALKASPVDATAPAPRDPLQLRLLDRDGRERASAAFWPGAVALMPSGEQHALERAPALPVWPSAWTSLEPPHIRAASLVSAERLTLEGPVALDLDAMVELGRLLEGLTARDFMGGGSVNWAGAAQMRVRLADGASIDLQQVPDGEGRFFLRMTSAERTDVRMARNYAFRMADPLP